MNEERSLRLKIDKGGCGIISASNKMHFAHLASACQVLPAVGKHLREMGWRENSIEDVVDFVGVEQCLQMLGRKGIFISTDGCIHVSPPTYPINGKSILWGQARKLFGALSDKLQELDDIALRASYTPTSRHTARLNSASGPAAGKWLDAFPSSWWPEFSDEAFIMALRFRSGIPIVAPGQFCMHHKCKDDGTTCGGELDV